MPTKEKNEVRMIGVLPSQGADPIPVRLSTEAAGADMIEKNEVRMVGVLPSQGADPIPVSGMLYPSPLSIPPAAFIPIYDTYDWFIIREYLKNRAALTAQYYIAPVNLPNGVTVTKATLYAYRDDALSALSCGMERSDRANGLETMWLIAADWITGWSSKYDDTIDFAVVNNDTYCYTLILVVDPNNSVEDVKFSGVKIEFTG